MRGGYPLIAFKRMGPPGNTVMLGRLGSPVYILAAFIRLFVCWMQDVRILTNFIPLIFIFCGFLFKMFILKVKIRKKCVNFESFL